MSDEPGERQASSGDKTGRTGRLVCVCVCVCVTDRPPDIQDGVCVCALERVRQLTVSPDVLYGSSPVLGFKLKDTTT